MKELQNFSCNRISKMVVSTMLGHSLSKIYEEIISQEELHRSYHFFYGDFVILYGGIKEQKSKICCLSFHE